MKLMKGVKSSLVKKCEYFMLFMCFMVKALVR